VFIVGALAMPQVYRAPALTDWNVIMPETGTGVALFAVRPFPSSPALLSPQQYNTPVVDNAHA
jgi:hypothetical protein